MEDDNRPFQAVTVGLTGVETGRERFTKDNVYLPPPASSWRCNLTALSQRYNLYFVASGSGIAVYQPEFPFQKLKRTPQLFVPLTIANPHAGGFVHPSRPHEIDHLLVGDLGNEEIIVAATDSGNVVAYYTKAIDGAIRKDPYRFSTNGRSDYVGVRAFFSQWVWESAWGLAIHREARMIAVSSNVPYHVPDNDRCAKILVFSFALCQQSETGLSSSTEITLNDKISEMEWHDWHATKSTRAHPPRDRNYRVVLGGWDGHQNNIPSISFLNTPEDVDGAWLISTDIHGVTKVWQTWRQFCYMTTDLSEQPNELSTRTRRREGGWLVVALEPSAFWPVTSMAQFCGHSEITKYRGHVGESYDITDAVKLRIPGNSHDHPLVRTWNNLDEPDETEDQPEFVWPEDDSEDEVSVENTEAFVVSPETSYGSTQAQSDRTGEQQLRTNFSENERNPNQAPQSENMHGNTNQPSNTNPFLQRFAMLQNVMNAFAEDSNISSEEEWLPSNDDSIDDDDDDDEDEEVQGDSDGELQNLPFSPASLGTATSISSVPNLAADNSDVENARPVSRSSALNAKFESLSTKSGLQVDREQIAHEAKVEIRIPSIPTLHTSSSHLRIINLPRSATPHIVCKNMLIQTLPHAFGDGEYPAIDRLNMVQQIPELGIVIVASQIGRCAVCSLTKRGTSGLLGLRVDWILPTAKQERRGLRPTRPLLGIATAPVQGRFLKPRRLSTEPDGVEHGMQDCEIDGVSTTFDPEVLVLGQKTDGLDIDNENQRDFGVSGADKDKRTKRKRKPSVTKPEVTQITTERRAWKKSAESESWRAVETSRRYRLMITYADMTVLTYELSRTIDKDDVAGLGTSKMR